VSSAHVGSSARINSGLLIIALAIATLCCCHQESWFGNLSYISGSQTRSSISIAFSFLSLGEIH
jgi:hypothetical protein